MAIHTLYIRATPKASRRMLVVEREDNGVVHARAYVTCAPEDGKANAAVIELLAEHLGIAKSRITLKSGQTNRNKVFVVQP